MILDKLTRSRIYSSKGKPVEIGWPQDAPEPKKGTKYTIQSSAEKAGETKLIVEGIREVPDGFRVTVRLDSDPVRLLGKSGGYATSSQGAIGTRKPVEQNPHSGPQFRSEVEPEGVDAETQRRITMKGRHDRAEFQEELARENKELAADQARQKERAMRDRVRQVSKGLAPEAAIALYAAIERECQKVEMEAAA